MYKLTHRVGNPLFIAALILFGAAAVVPFANIPPLLPYLHLVGPAYRYTFQAWQLLAGAAVCFILPALIYRGGAAERLTAGLTALFIGTLYAFISSMVLNTLPGDAGVHISNDGTVLMNWVALAIAGAGGLLTTFALLRSEKVATASVAPTAAPVAPTATAPVPAAAAPAPSATKTDNGKVPAVEAKPAETPVADIAQSQTGMKSGGLGKALSKEKEKEKEKEKKEDDDEGTNLRGLLDKLDPEVKQAAAAKPVIPKSNLPSKSSSTPPARPSSAAVPKKSGTTGPGNGSGTGSSSATTGSTTSKPTSAPASSTASSASTAPAASSTGSTSQAAKSPTPAGTTPATPAASDKKPSTPTSTATRLQAQKRKSTSTFTKLQALSASGSSTGAPARPKSDGDESDSLKSILDRLDTGMDEYDQDILSPNESLLLQPQQDEPEPPDLSALQKPKTVEKQTKPLAKPSEPVKPAAKKSSETPAAKERPVENESPELHEESLMSAFEAAPAPSLSAMLDAMDTEPSAPSPVAKAVEPASTTSGDSSSISPAAKADEPSSSTTSGESESPAGGYTMDDLLAIKTPKVTTGGLSSLTKDKPQRSGKDFIRRTDSNRSDEGMGLGDDDESLTQEESLISDTLTLNPDNSSDSLTNQSMDFAPHGADDAALVAASLAAEQEFLAAAGAEPIEAASDQASTLDLPMGDIPAGSAAVEQDAIESATAASTPSFSESDTVVTPSQSSTDVASLESKAEAPPEVAESSAIHAEPTEAKTETSEPKTEPAEMSAEEKAAYASTVETPVQAEAAPEPVEAKTETEAKSEPAETTAVTAGTAESEAAEAKVEPVEERVELVEAKTEPVEDRVELVEAKTEPVEDKAEPIEAKTEPAEDKAEPVEAKTEPAEPVTPPAEDRAADVEAAAIVSTESISRPEEAETKSESVESTAAPAAEPSTVESSSMAVSDSIPSNETTSDSLMGGFGTIDADIEEAFSSLPEAAAEPVAEPVKAEEPSVTESTNSDVTSEIAYAAAAAAATLDVEPIVEPASSETANVFGTDIDRDIDDIFSNLAPPEAQREVLQKTETDVQAPEAAAEPAEPVTAKVEEAPETQAIEAETKSETVPAEAPTETKSATAEPESKTEPVETEADNVFGGKIDKDIDDLFSAIVPEDAQKEVKDSGYKAAYGEKPAEAEQAAASPEPAQAVTEAQPSEPIAASEPPAVPQVEPVPASSTATETQYDEPEAADNVFGGKIDKDIDDLFSAIVPEEAQKEVKDSGYKHAYGKSADAAQESVQPEETKSEAPAEAPQTSFEPVANAQATAMENIDDVFSSLTKEGDAEPVPPAVTEAPAPDTVSAQVEPAEAVIPNVEQQLDNIFSAAEADATAQAAAQAPAPLPPNHMKVGAAGRFNQTLAHLPSLQGTVEGLLNNLASMESNILEAAKEAPVRKPSTSAVDLMAQLAGGSEPEAPSKVEETVETAAEEAQPAATSEAPATEAPAEEVKAETTPEPLQEAAQVEFAPEPQAEPAKAEAEPEATPELTPEPSKVEEEPEPTPEPAPEPAKVEAKPEPTPEPAPEPAKVEAKPEPTPEPAPEPAKVEAKPEPTPESAPEPAKVEAKPEPTPEPAPEPAKVEAKPEPAKAEPAKVAPVNVTPAAQPVKAEVKSEVTPADNRGKEIAAPPTVHSGPGIGQSLKDAEKAKQSATVEKQLKEFGRLSSKSGSAEQSSAPPGTMKTIGKLLIEVQAVENIINKGEATGKLGSGLTTARVISAAKGEGIRTLLCKIDEYPNVVGSIIVGHDGLVIASTVPQGMDKDALGALSLACLGTSNLATRKLEIGKLIQMVMITDKYLTVLTDVDVGILAVYMDSVAVDKVDGLREAIQQTVS